jgi:hypothetical protein
MPDPSAPPQPQTPRQTPLHAPRKRPSRFWLFAPYVLLLVVALGWTAYWWAASGRLQHKLELQAEALQKQGYTARWSSIRVVGYPFRLHLILTGPRFADTAGWGLSATRLEAQAMAYAPDTWVLAAPEGLIVSRPGKGDVAVSGKAIRASIAAIGSPQPRFAFEGDALTLAPGQGA